MTTPTTPAPAPSRHAASRHAASHHAASHHAASHHAASHHAASHHAASGHLRRHAVRHYLEMVVAMVVGMAVLDPVWNLLWPVWTERLEVHVLVMATDMAIGMGAWMLFRGHSRRAVAEMSAAMYVPFLALLPPFWAGLVPAGVVLTAGHLLMLPAMAAVMVWRPEEYGLPRRI